MLNISLTHAKREVASVLLEHVADSIGQAHVAQRDIETITNLSWETVNASLKSLRD